MIFKVSFQSKPFHDDLYQLHSVHGKLIYNERGRTAGREKLSFLKWCCLLPIFSILAKGVLPKVVKGDKAKGTIQESSSKAQPSCCCDLD